MADVRGDGGVQARDDAVEDPIGKVATMSALRDNYDCSVRFPSPLLQALLLGSGINGSCQTGNESSQTPSKAAHSRATSPEQLFPPNEPTTSPTPLCPRRLEEASLWHATKTVLLVNGFPNPIRPWSCIPGETLWVLDEVHPYRFGAEVLSCPVTEVCVLASVRARGRRGGNFLRRREDDFVLVRWVYRGEAGAPVLFRDL